MVDLAKRLPRLKPTLASSGLADTYTVRDGDGKYATVVVYVKATPWNAPRNPFGNRLWSCSCRLNDTLSSEPCTHAVFVGAGLADGSIAHTGSR